MGFVAGFAKNGCVAFELCRPLKSMWDMNLSEADDRVSVSYKSEHKLRRV